MTNKVQRPKRTKAIIMMELKGNGRSENPSLGSTIITQPFNNPVKPVRRNQEYNVESTAKLPASLWPSTKKIPQNSNNNQPPLRIPETPVNNPTFEKKPKNSQTNQQPPIDRATPISAPRTLEKKFHENVPYTNLQDLISNDAYNYNQGVHLETSGFVNQNYRKGKNSEAISQKVSALFTCCRSETRCE